MTKNNDFSELVKAIKEHKPFENKYYLSCMQSKSFETPFKYTNGESICVGDIVKISYESDKGKEYSQKTDKGTFIVKFDGACETEDDYYLWDGEHSKRFDERENIEKITNVYAYLIYKQLDERSSPIAIVLERYYNNEINEVFTKDISPHRSDDLYEKNIYLKWEYDNDKFKLEHNEIDEFIQFCKKSLKYSHSVESLIDSPKVKETNIQLRILYNKIENITLNDFVKFCLKDEIANEKDLYYAIKEQEENDINYILFQSIKSNDYQKVKECLDNGANVNMQYKNYFGFHPPLMHAIDCKSSLEIQELLIERGADVNAKDIDDNTALKYAVDKNELNSVKLLIKNGANVNAKISYDNITFLDLATRRGYMEIAELLIDNGAEIEYNTNKFHKRR